MLKVNIVKEKVNVAEHVDGSKQYANNDGKIFFTNHVGSNTRILTIHDDQSNPLYKVVKEDDYDDHHCVRYNTYSDGSIKTSILFDDDKKIVNTYEPGERKVPMLKDEVITRSKLDVVEIQEEGTNRHLMVIGEKIEVIDVTDILDGYYEMDNGVKPFIPFLCCE